MTKMDKLLIEEKDKLNKLEIPDDIESKLRDTLNNIPDLKKKSFRGRVAAILIIVLLMSYNIDTLAYYGKKLIGYENVMSGTLQELNELGKGQSINKSYTFKNGVEALLDGVMLDDNNMVVFYTIKAPNKDVMEAFDNMGRTSITGFLGKEYIFNGAGEANKDMKEMKWVLNTHETPKFYDRTMKFNMNYEHEDGSFEQGEIVFKLDRNQAVGKSLKVAINEKIKLDNNNIVIQSLVASPTMTVIKGQIQNIIELGIDYISKDRYRTGEINIVLLADGKEVPIHGSGMSTNMKGITFDITYDALPKETKNLELKLLSFGGDYDVKEEAIELVVGETRDISILGQDIEINKVYEEGDNTYITFTTQESTALSRVYLNIDGEKFELQDTIPGESEKVVEGDFVKIYYTRTMRFNGTGEKLELDIQRIRYNKEYDKTIYEYKLD